MKQIIVFGATGGTGKAVVTEALNRGYRVTAVVRNLSALEINHESLSIIEGDVLQPLSFSAALKNADAVISCLGNGRNLGKTSVYSQGTQNIMTAMHMAKVQRLVCISAGALEANSNMGGFTRILVKVLQYILKNPYNDIRLMEQEVKKDSLNWTIIRPARLTNKTSRTYRTAINSHLKNPHEISRNDVAKYMLDSINDKLTYKSVIEIAY